MSTTRETYSDGARVRRDEARRRFGLKPHIVVSVHIDAPPEAVWEVVADVTRSGEWSGESKGCEWVGGATHAVQGAQFRGRNLRRGARWVRVNEVLQADQPRELAWRTLSMGMYRDSTEWRITLQPEAGGTRVSEEMQIVRMSRLMDIFLYWVMTPHRDRTEDLTADLERLKRVVEAGRTQPASR